MKLSGKKILSQQKIMLFDTIEVFVRNPINQIQNSVIYDQLHLAQCDRNRAVFHHLLSN